MEFQGKDRLRKEDFFDSEEEFQNYMEAIKPLSDIWDYEDSEGEKQLSLKINQQIHSEKMEKPVIH